MIFTNAFIKYSIIEYNFILFLFYLLNQYIILSALLFKKNNIKNIKDLFK
jgi:hypothetical protein